MELDLSGWLSLLFSGATFIVLYLSGPSRANNPFIRRSNNRFRIGAMIVNAALFLIVASNGLGVW